MRGGCLPAKGEVVNPLKTVPFVQTLYFINGDDADQLAWMKRQVPETLMSKIILVRGSIPDTSAALDSRIYFDQNGVLSKRFWPDGGPGADHAGASGERLNIETFPPVPHPDLGLRLFKEVTDADDTGLNNPAHDALADANVVHHP